jgi:glycosyltransferase involved in cell wall biosynthesis
MMDQKMTHQKYALPEDIIIIDLPINLGLTAGFQAAMKYAVRKGYEYAVQYDGDGQHKAQYISMMLEAIRNDGFDFVIGSRFIDIQKPKTIRMLGSRLIGFILFITTGKKISDPTSGIRMFNKKFISIFANSSEYGPEPDIIALFIRSGFHFKEIPVTMDERVVGESYLNFKKSVIYMIHMLFSILFFHFFRKIEAWK